MNRSIRYLFGCLILQIFNDYISADISSFLEKYQDETEFSVIMSKAEEIFVHSVMPNLTNEDAVCSLSNEKKLELCRIIFNTKYNQNVGVYINKIPFFFKTKLPCTERKLILRYFHANHGRVVVRRMYPCFGRHENIRTSFIEDDFYDTFYLSAGPEINSVTVSCLVELKNDVEMNLFDFVYHINFSKLSNMVILKRDIVKELGLNKKIYISNNEEEVESIYDIEQKYSEHDPICDLPYEKRITLCRLLFDQYMYKDALHVTLNKAATYMFSMHCVTKPVKKASTDMDKQYRDRQKMYACHGRRQIPTDSNLLSDEYVKTFFLSSGSRRNSVFSYFRSKHNFKEHYRVMELIENIDFRALKLSTITEEELADESKETYAKIKDIMISSEKEYLNEILNIIIQFKPNEIELENRKLEQMIEANEEAYCKSIEAERDNKKRAALKKLVAEYKEKELDPTKTISEISSSDSTSDKNKKPTDKNKSMQLFTLTNVFHKNENISDMFDFVQLGSQVYKRLLEKIRFEMKSKLFIPRLENKSPTVTTEMINALKEKIQEMNKIKEPMKKNIKLNNEIQRLIKNMEIFAIETNLYNINLAEKMTSTKTNKKIDNVQKEEKKIKRKKKK